MSSSEARWTEKVRNDYMFFVIDIYVLWIHIAANCHLIVISEAFE